MAEDPNRVTSAHNYVAVKQCYENPSKLIEYNKRKFGWSDNDAKITAEGYCGRMLMKAQKSGVGIIILNMLDEGTHINI